MITAGSVLHFFEALLWCALLFASIAGYGAILVRCFGLRRPSIALAASAGFGVVVALGGCLNLLHAITRPVLLAMTLFGLLAAAVLRIVLSEPRGAGDGHQAATQVSRGTAVVLILFAVVFAVRVGATVHWRFYQDSDDYNYYLGAPEKTLALHRVAPDPFSERRVMSSVGGNYFLQDMVIDVLPLANVQMADRTLGLILLALMAFAISAEFGLTANQRAVFALLVLIVPQLTFNLTFVLLPSALFFGLVYLAANRKIFADSPLLLGLLLGMVAGAIASTKSTYLPHGVLFVAGVALFHGRRRGYASGLGLLLAGALGCFVVMGPWMIASHAASGTFFYPSLGVGYHYSAYGVFPPPGGISSQVLVHKVLPFCVPLLLVLLAGWLLGDKDEQGESMVALMAATLAATFVLGMATGGDSARRYNYPCIVPSILLLYIVFSRRVNREAGKRSWRILQTLSAALAVATSLAIGLNKFTNEYAQIPVGLKDSLSNFSIVPADVRAAYTVMQEAIPPDGGVLATVKYSFLLDFRAHPIDVADFPGAASLAPGWPSRQTGEALGQYLLANHIRYLVYDYDGWVRSDPYDYRFIDNPSTYSQWLRTEHEIVHRSHEQYGELARSRRHLYDDGKMYVLDLATPASAGGVTTGPLAGTQ